MYLLQMHHYEPLWGETLPLAELSSSTAGMRVVCNVLRFIFSAHYSDFQKSGFWTWGGRICPVLPAEISNSQKLPSGEGIGVNLRKEKDGAAAHQCSTRAKCPSILPSLFVLEGFLSWNQKSRNTKKSAARLLSQWVWQVQEGFGWPQGPALGALPVLQGQFFFPALCSFPSGVLIKNLCF